MSHMKILFVGGGSIGHIAPCIAVWKAVQKKNPNTEAYFICSQRDDDAAFLRSEGVCFAQIQIPRLTWRFPWRFLSGIIAAANILRAFHPDVIFSKGGAVSVPVCLVARMMHIPIMLHESDAVMGRANALISKLATVILTGFPLEQKPNDKLQIANNSQFAIRNSQFVGNPIRPEITHGSRNEGLRITGLSGTRPILLVMGGSQGAQKINEIVWELLSQVLGWCDVIHITGKGKGQIKNQKSEIRNHYFSLEFAQKELPHFYALASLALSRSGAGAIGELAANGIPSILVPIRGLAQDHQQANALFVEKIGGCILISQEHLRTKLAGTIYDLLMNREKCEALATHMRTVIKDDASENIAALLLSQCRHRN